MRRSFLSPMVLAFGSVLLLAACDDDGAAENAGEAVDEAVEDAGDAIEDATD